MRIDLGLTLTDTQVRFFKTFGFLKLPGVLKPNLDAILNEFDRIMEAHCITWPHDHERRTLKWQLIDSSPLLSSLIDRAALGQCFSQLLGKDFVYMGSSGNFYAGDTGWHTDDFNSHRRAKACVYLDEVDEASGALRVMPGTHRVEPWIKELHMAVGSSLASLGVNGAELPCEVLASSPGDVIFFDQNVFHSSFHGGSQRRMFSINAHSAYSDVDRSRLENSVLSLGRFGYAEPYGACMLDGPSERLVHLEPVLECAGGLPDATRRWMSELSEPSRDPLPDLSSNTDPKVAQAEYEKYARYEPGLADARS